MNLLHLLVLLFVAVPIAEIYLLLEVGGVIGALPTIGLVVLTAVVGSRPGPCPGILDDTAGTSHHGRW